MLIVSCLLSMRLRTSTAEYNANVRPCQSWLKPVAALLQNIRSEEKDYALSPAFFFYRQQLVLLDSIVVFSYYLDIFMHAIAPPATEAR
jgi:hypothetical protein